MPTPTPRDLPTELRTAYREGNLIVVVGPELSSAAGLPGTEHLAEQLLELAVERGLHLDQARLSRWIGEGRSADALGLLEGSLGADFQRQIERRLSDQSAVIPSLAKIIACLGERLRAVYTTGLDRLLERAFLDQWPSFAIPRADLAQRRALIFKLRGTLEFAQSWVLTAEQRAREFSSRSLRQAVFEAAYNAHQLVFVGFTPGSELLVCLLDMVEAAAGAGQGPSHFFVAADCGLEERMQLERRGLELIRGPTEAVLRELGGLAEGEGEVRTMTAEALEITGSPYPGLQAFTEERAQLFFGRQAEISQAASRLGGLGSDHRRWLAIEGSSGIGKSSFAQAGIVPALRRGFGANTPARWRVATIRPGEGDSDEHPQHEVELDSFYLARTEVTNAQYALYLEANPDAPKPKFWENERYNQPQQPVVGVSWYDAKAYCDWAGLVLPTEAQWEYATRAGTTTTYWFGDDAGDLGRFGWYLDNSGARNHSVGSKDANDFGLVDVAGNVWEWTHDAHGDYTTNPRAGDGLRRKPVGGTNHVIRSGSRDSFAGGARSGDRVGTGPGIRNGNVGFRAAQVIPADVPCPDDPCPKVM